MKKLVSFTDTAGKSDRMTPEKLVAARRELRKLAEEAQRRQLAAWESAKKVHLK